MNTLADEKASPSDVKSLYATSFALVTPANKDEDDGHNILVPIKEEPIDDDDNHLLVTTPDQPADKPCIPTSNTKSEQESSPVSQLTHMDTEDYTFDNIEPLPYNDDEQIALHGCLGNHFVDLMNSPAHPPSIGTEKAIAFEDLPDLPDIEAISAASPHLFPFYPPHWPSYQGLPHPYHASRNFGYSQTDDHSTNSNSTSSLRPKLSNNPSTAPYGRRFANPLRNTAEEQEIIPEPTDNDVLCGRGGAINNHPGNKRFRHFINELKYQYLNESKQTKPKVAMRVLQLVSQSNPPGRFLMKFPEGYLECSEERAKEKASQALREGAAKLRKQGHIDKKKEEKLTGGLVVKSIKLPIERVRDMPHYSDDAKYCNEFEPPRPRKKSKRTFTPV